MAKILETTLEIDLKALAHNYNYLRSKLQPDTKFMGVVKAYAYGSNAPAIAHKLVQLGADYLAVAYVKEGIALRQAGIAAPILVFHPLLGNFETLIVHRLTPTIYSKRTLKAFIKMAETMRLKNYPVHLNFNTGLNRLGFEYDEIDYICGALSQTDAVKVEGIYSHLAASEDKHERAFTLQQIEQFKRSCQALTDKLSYQPIRHICNTSGILNYPEAHFEMVRGGIGMHGYGNSAQEDQQLIPVASLKTLISQIHHIQAGESVSYNRRFKAAKPTTTATLSLGYTDGIHRNYSNGKTHVLINGEYAPIIGDICMDMIMVDVTGIACEEGDEVLIFGKTRSADALAHEVETISYELMTTISQRVKRVVLNS